MKKKGFTLIELLVVISIIGILATLMISRYGMAEKSARDAERKSDLNQYRTALENYAVKTGGLYPVRSLSDASASPGLCNDLGTSYISQCPQDPRQDGSTYYYRYQTNNPNPASCSAGDDCATNYILWAVMETGSGTNFWYICADGKASEKTSQPASTDCF